MTAVRDSSGLAQRRIRRVSSEEREQVLESLAVRRSDRWLLRFVVMLGLSVVIAVMGLFSNSAAVVIGAMLIAPMMTPVLGMAACLAMGWVRLGSRSAVTVVGASVGAIALAWLLALLVPDAGLTAEELSRTAPALTDLLVALAAGAAGAYATLRADVSSSLPGVAVAVALVPPLATVGVTLQLGRTDLARGALLLYVANLLAIIFAGLVVFVVTGFVPAQRLAQLRGRVGVIAVVVGAALVLIALPLLGATSSAVARAREIQKVNAATATWLGGRGLDVTGVSVTDARVRIDVAGPVEPPPTDSLASILDQSLGRSTVVEVRWTQRSAVPNAAAPPSNATTTPAEAQRAAVEAAITTWLDSTGSAADFQVSNVTINGSQVTLDLLGPSTPPSTKTLTAAITDIVGAKTKVTVRWSQQVVVGNTGPTALDETARVRRVADAWAATQPFTQVTSINVTTATVTIDISAPQPPATNNLVAQVQSELARTVAVTVLYTERRVLSSVPTTTFPSTTTSITPTTSTPTATVTTAVASTTITTR
ncbi:MAG: DUF389 domain-containing protein [Acidimicrobiales bacterium]